MTRTADQRCLGHAVFGVIVVLARFCAYGQTNETPEDVFLVNTTEPFTNGSGEAQQVLAIRRPCGPEHEGYCFNGVCTFSPEMNTPICQCNAEYNGVRCQHVLFVTQNLSSSEEVIGITCGVILLLGALIALIVYCILRKRKSSPPYKNYGSENSA